MSPTVLVCTALLSEGFRKVCKCWWRQTPPSPRRCQSWLKSKRGFTYINGGCLQVTNILLTFYVRLSLHLMGHTRASALLQAVLMGKLRALWPPHGCLCREGAGVEAGRTYGLGLGAEKRPRPGGTAAATHAKGEDVHFWSQGARLSSRLRSWTSDNTSTAAQLLSALALLTCS